MEIVELLLASGADPAARNAKGETAADWALQRGMRDVARRLGVFGQRVEERRPATYDIQEYERLAQDLVFAFETGQPAAMQHLMTFFGGSITWDGLRKEVLKRLERTWPRSARGLFRAPARASAACEVRGMRDLGRLARCT